MISIPLSNSSVLALLDDEFVSLTQLSWFLSKDGYVSSLVGTKHIYMHHMVIGYPPEGLVTDHRNRIKHDNQKHNLRHVTHAQNMQNKERGTSQYLGVFLNKKTGKWRARIKKDGKIYLLGTFVHEIHAAMAYDTKSRELYGSTATLNFPTVGLEIQKIAGAGTVYYHHPGLGKGPSGGAYRIR